MRSARPYQPTLFEKPAPSEPAVVLNIKMARQLRDEGIDQAEGHADNDRSGWSGEAYLFLKKFLENHNGEFRVEDVRSYAAMEDFDLPPSNRAWGAVILRAKSEGIVESFRVDKVRNKKAHCANAAVWMKVKPIDSNNKWDE